MFRSKKPAGNGADQSAPAAAPAEPAPPPVEEVLELKTAPRRPVPLRPLPAASPLELNRRAADLAATAGRSDGNHAAAREKTLVIGREVVLEGQISACERLMVEGTARVSASGCQRLCIGATGLFHGRIEVMEAEIHGQFDGELTVHGLLIIRPGGIARGTIRYRTINIDAGGQIAGDVAALDPAGAAVDDRGAVPLVSPAGDFARPASLS